MNEELEYAEMLEIPVSTVNVVRKTRRRKKRSCQTVSAQEPVLPLKDSVIAQVNNRVNNNVDEGEGNIDFDADPNRIDTVRLYASGKKGMYETELFAEKEQGAWAEDEENEATRYEMKSKPSKFMRIALGVEFGAVCALCAGIFLTNVFVPDSAVNTFFRALTTPAQTVAIDERSYSDFTLSPVVSDLSKAELTLSPTGILSFTEACHVYPSANGEVGEIIQNGDTYSVKICYSDTFTGVINGLDTVYYEVGDQVKANVPVGYTNGETEVQVTMYSEGALLNCFELTDENCLAWVEQE